MTDISEADCRLMKIVDRHVRRLYEDSVNIRGGVCWCTYVCRLRLTSSLRDEEIGHGTET